MISMNDISGSNYSISKNYIANELMVKFMDIFQQLPQGFQITFLCGCLAIFTYIIHEGYCITISESGLQITKYTTVI